MPITLSPTDPRLRVFAASDTGGAPLATQSYLDGPAADPAPLRAALGAQVDPAHVEVVELSDLAPMSLRDYLAQAHDVDPSELAADAARLDGLSGRVVLVLPRAVEGLAFLDPDATLTEMGAYRTARADHAARPLPRAAPEARVATPGAAADTGPSGRTIALAVGAALVLAVLLFALL